jgi:hypothetical protein
MQQFTHVDETVVSCPVHCIVTFVVTCFDAGARSKKKIGEAHVTTLHSTQEWRETKRVSDVDTRTCIKQTA